MEERNGNGVPPKPAENGVKGKAPYFVETPYGFRLDLDFLKYVDDIEKGNTIKRVPIQRRSKGPRSSTLPRHLNLSGPGYRPSPWGSTGALTSRSPLSDPQQGFSSWLRGRSSLGSQGGYRSLAEAEARIRAFDEQPLGEHIRPHLLRASSLPLTVLLRQGSESTNDPGSLRSSIDCLGGRDTSSEDVFTSPDLPVSPEFSGLLRRLSKALERVGELEMEVRLVPELRAQICILQEEKERLRLGLAPPAPGSRPASALNGTQHPSSWASDLKRPRQDSLVRLPRDHSSLDNSDATHEWRSSSDLDELLTVTALQAKVAALEQRLHENGLELRRASELLREQQEESRRKEARMKQLAREAGARGRPERDAIDQEGMVEDGTGSGSKGALDHGQSSSSGLNVGGHMPKGGDSFRLSMELLPEATETAPQDKALLAGVDSAVAAHHVQKIQRLLEQLWVIQCGGREPGEGGSRQEHPDPKATSLQQEMMGLVQILSSHYSQHKDSTQPGVPKSIMKQNGSARTSKNLHFASLNEGLPREDPAGVDWVQQAVSAPPREAQSPPGETASYLDVTQPLDRGGNTNTSNGSPPRTTEGVSMETDDPEKAAEMDSHPAEQTEANSATTISSETVKADFMAACLFLRDHMDSMDNPNEDTRQALEVLFPTWFQVAAEEDSLAQRVALHVREVRKVTPGLLPFLVNLADDNGNTALHYSVSHCNYSIVSLLLDTGVCEVDVQNKAGYTAVMLASLTAPTRPGDMEVVRRLMETSQVNSRSDLSGQTALQLAVRYGRVVMVCLLLSCGAQANLQDDQGTTALMTACERGYTHIARLLLERACCDLALTDSAGRTALSIALQGSSIALQGSSSALQGSSSDTASLLQAHSNARGL